MRSYGSFCSNCVASHWRKASRLCRTDALRIAAQQVHIPHLSLVACVPRIGQQLVDQFFSLLWIGVGQKRGRFLVRRNHADEVEIDSPQKHRSPTIAPAAARFSFAQAALTSRSIVVAQICFLRLAPTRKSDPPTRRITRPRFALEAYIVRPCNGSCQDLRQRAGLSGGGHFRIQFAEAARACHPRRAAETGKNCEWSGWPFPSRPPDMPGIAGTGRPSSVARRDCRASPAAIRAQKP